jgi:antitoxin VapB
MVFRIKDKETDRLARELAELTGESLTMTVKTALRERLERVRRLSRRPLSEELDEIAMACAALPVDTRESDEILGYDERGL